MARRHSPCCSGKRPIAPCRSHRVFPPCSPSPEPLPQVATWESPNPTLGGTEVSHQHATLYGLVAVTSPTLEYYPSLHYSVRVPESTSCEHCYSNVTPKLTTGDIWALVRVELGHFEVLQHQVLNNAPPCFWIHRPHRSLRIWAFKSRPLKHVFLQSLW